MAGKNLMWAFAMKSFAAKGTDLSKPKVHEAHADVCDMNALFNLSDFKPECRIEMFEQINRALGPSAPLLKTGPKLKV